MELFGMVDPRAVDAGGAAALAAAGIIGWRWWQKRRLEQEIERRKQILQGSASVRAPSETWLRSRGEGQIAILSCGGFGSHLLPVILQTFERANVADHVGIIYHLELDGDDLQLARRNIPEVFQHKIVTTSCALMYGGGIGDPIADVETKQEYWKHDVMEGTRTWVNRIDRETKPVILIALLSPGGMSAMADPVLDAFIERNPQVAVYAITILDHKTVVRQRFPTLRQKYFTDGRVRGTILCDNRRDSVRNDLGVAMLLAGMVGATWIDNLPLAPWNALSYVFPKEQAGGFATLSVWADYLPVYYLPPWGRALPEVYYTKAALLEGKAIRGIKELMQRPDIQAVPLEPAGAGRTRLTLVNAPIVPDPDYRISAERVNESLAEWRAETDPDLLINYASVAAPLTPEATQTPMVLVLLQPLETDGTDLDALAQGTYQIDPKFLAPPARPALVGRQAPAISAGTAQEQEGAKR